MRPVNEVKMPSNYGRDKLWPFAQGGGATLAVFTIVFAGALLLWFAWPHLVSGILLTLFGFLWLTVLYFFRDPNRISVDQPGQIIGPGDGRVVAIETMMEPRYLQQEVIRLSMFLNLTDVHVQRVPLGGTVTFVDYQPGKFLQAFRPEASGGERIHRHGVSNAIR